MNTPYDPSYDEQTNKMIAAASTPVESEAVPAETNEPAPAPAPVESTAREIEEAKAAATLADHRWRVAQGMIRKKDEELRALNERIAAMERQVSTVAAPAPRDYEISRDEELEFGTDFIAVATKIAKREVAEAMAQLRSELSASVSRPDQEPEQPASSTDDAKTEMFYWQLSQTVPDWEATNSDPAFLAWLGEADPYSGIARMDGLTTAFEHGDAARVAFFFKQFKGRTPVENVKPSTEKLVSPGKSRSTNAPSNEKRVWDTASINQLYKDADTGKITPAEFKALEQDLFAAQNEGRYTR